MDNLIKADIFFFIASIASVVFGLLLLIVLVYFVKILRDLRYIVSIVKEKTDEVAEELSIVMDSIMRKQAKASIFSKVLKVFIKALFLKSKRR